MGRFAIRTAALVVAAAATLAALEGGTRLLLPERSYEAWRSASLRYRHDPRWHWTLRPGTYRGPGGAVHVNTLGLRGPEVERPKPAGRLRVLALGGSSTFNYRATGGRTWPVILEERLAGRLAADLEVVNGATPGYSSYQSSERFRHQYRDWEPDLVLVYHLWNDLKLFWMTEPREMVAKWDTHGRFNEASTLLDPFPFLDGLSRHSQLVTHSRFAGIALGMRRRQVSDEGWIHSRLDKRIAPEGVAFYRSNLESLARLCADRNIPLLIVEQALFLPDTPAGSGAPRIRYDYVGFDHPTLLEAVARGRAAARAVAEANGAGWVETDGLPRSRRFFQDHVHLTDRGLDRLAKLLTPAAEAILAGPGGS